MNHDGPLYFLKEESWYNSSYNYNGVAERMELLNHDGPLYFLEEESWYNSSCNYTGVAAKEGIMEKIQDLLTRIFLSEGENKLVKMIFGSKRRKSLEYNKVAIRPVLLGGKLVYQAEFSYDKKVTHKNVAADEAYKLSLSLINEDFKQINIFFENEEVQVLASKIENPRISRRFLTEQNSLESQESQDSSEAFNSSNTLGKSAAWGSPKLSNSFRAANLEHNRTKKYIIPDGKPCDFLVELGVMGQDGKVFPRHYSKFRQINRYLEIVEDVFKYLPEGRTLRIIDFGCGKAYLTFALYHYLKIIKNRSVEIIGLDLKEDVINFCSDVARRLGYDELKFFKGDIADYTSDYADMVVTLHACDTATDYALINAVRWNTKVILSVPCCQHELFNQINNDIHRPMLKHGILKDRLTEYLTDGLRALKLESKGYDVAMIEFTSLEHTARNIMIKAVKPDFALASVSGGTSADKRSLSYNSRAATRKMQRANEQYEALCEFYQVHPTIDKL